MHIKLTLSTQGFHRQSQKGGGGTEEKKELHTQNITAFSTFATPPYYPLQHTQLSAPSVLVGTSPEPLAHSSPATDPSSLTQNSLCKSSTSSAYLSNISSLHASSTISSFSLSTPCAILGKSRLGNAGVFASNSVSATRNVFEPQSILLNNAAYVTSQRIRVGGEKEDNGEEMDLAETFERPRMNVFQSRN
ncbi:uncharacterized protein MONOS_18001 [Monocercomonoides exilis]|uniref:uncharacterized protein n=1 Tax=Monocercomonoides exilis TaxID=2049356 RepID=UPI00355A5B22|nr:hypothetical protein MONOS_18001 [Monocercomonoides exilis]